MTDHDDLVKEFERLTTPETPATQHFQQSGHHNTQLNVTGDNNQVTAQQDTLGRILEHAKPHASHFAATFGVITFVILALRLLQIALWCHGSITAMNTWINQNDPLILLRCAGAGICLAVIWETGRYLLRHAWRQVRHH